MPRPINETTAGIIAAAGEIHRSLGPGLLQDAYLLSLAYELRDRLFEVKQSVTFPLVYKKMEVARGYSVDLIVDEQVLVNVLAVDHLLPVHSSRLMTALRFSGRSAGIIINFSHERLEHRSVILASISGC